MKLLPTGRQNFEDVIKENLLYVDKTRQVFELLRQGRLYFLSRPRRFGKSLLVSLFRHLFLGNRDLFKDLYIGLHTDYDFVEYPVLQFNFADFGLKTKNLEEELELVIQGYAAEFGVDIETSSIATQFRTLIQNISRSRGKPVALLIDEYDKPIIDFLTEVDKAEANQQILRQLFGPLKGLEAAGHLRFLFITGVSKFSKVSLFSDLNNLTDLSIHSLSHDLLGITQAELTHYFGEYMDQAASKYELTREGLTEAIKNWYNGYSYDGKTRLHNPFSLLQFFQNQQFGNYWFATGTPTFLVETIRNRGIHPQEFEAVVLDENFLNRFSLLDLNMTGLLFQTGYLTIQQVEASIYETTYHLGYPNYEVRHSMMHNMVEAFTYQPASLVSQSLIEMRNGLRQGNIHLFMEALRVILSDLKYNWQPPKQYKSEDELLKMWEGYFHAVLYLITAYMDMSVRAELAHHKGRIDLVATTNDFVYLMEFKMESSARAALAQIKDREYALPFKNSPQRVFLVGINFSNEERNWESWEAEEWKD